MAAKHWKNFLHTGNTCLNYRNTNYRSTEIQGKQQLSDNSKVTHNAKDTYNSFIKL